MSENLELIDLGQGSPKSSTDTVWYQKFSQGIILVK